MVWAALDYWTEACEGYMEGARGSMVLTGRFEEE